MFHRETTVIRLTSVNSKSVSSPIHGEMFIAKDSMVRIIFGTQN